MDLGFFSASASWRMADQNDDSMDSGSLQTCLPAGRGGQAGAGMTGMTRKKGVGMAIAVGFRMTMLAFGIIGMYD